MTGSLELEELKGRVVAKAVASDPKLECEEATAALDAFVRWPCPPSMSFSSLAVSSLLTVYRARWLEHREEESEVCECVVTVSSGWGREGGSGGGSETCGRTGYCGVVTPRSDTTAR